MTINETEEKTLNTEIEAEPEKEIEAEIEAAVEPETEPESEEETEAEATDDLMGSTIVIPVVREERAFNEVPLTEAVDEEGEQTEMVFEEEGREKEGSTYVPGSLEELMLESIKRNEK